MRGSLRLQQSVSFLGMLCICAVAGANPLGPTIVNGSVGITNPTADILQITNSPGSVVNWQSFSIAPGETTRFIQQNAASAILNRVTGEQVSQLLGNLTSNGRVFLINGNGIIVGEGATIDTAGLVLSTLDMTNEDFIAGKFKFEGDENSGSIKNMGYIKTAPGGEVILIAPQIVNESVEGVENSGLIETEGGDLILAAGHAITITSLDDPDISFDVEAGDGEVINLGRLIAQGGSAEILASTILQSGEINADSIEVDESGTVRLVASKRIETDPDSVISARGPGAGGSIRIEATGDADAPATAVVSGTLVADGGIQGGRVEVLGDNVVVAQADVSASGANGGGSVRIGGDIQGGPALPASATVSVDGESRIRADATDDGDGGSVAVWSENRTEFHGYAGARGGDFGGDGGFVEVSGKEELVLKGSLDVGALVGDPGSILLDPKNIFIIPGASTEILAPTPGTDDRFSSSFTILPNGNILVRNQNADIGNLVDAGQISLYTPDGVLINSLNGSAANEQLGSLFQTTVADGNLVFRSPNAGATQSGAVILFSDETGLEIGRVSGSSPNEQLGLVVDFFNTPPGTYNIRSQLADVGGKVDAGTMILVNELTGLEIGRVSGFSAGDMVGSNSPIMRASGNYYLPVPNADIGTNVDAGSLFLVNGTTGNLIGRINGNNTNEFLGSNINLFSFSPDALITSTAHNNGALTNAGAMILAADVDLGGGNFERGRVMGTSADEFLGSGGFQFLNNGNYVIFSTGADVGAFTDAGSVILANRTTGNAIGRLNGDSTSEFLGSFGILSATNGNYWVRSPNADPGGVSNAGSLYLVSATTGLALGRFNGDTASEFFSQTFEQNSNIGFNRMLVRSATHTANRGFVGLFDSVDLGGGNFLVGSVTGAQGGDFVGSQSVQYLSNGNYLVGAPNYQNATTPNAGALFVVDNATGSSILGPILGDTSGEQLGSFGDIDTFTLGSIDNFLIYSPEHGGDAGAIYFVNGSDTPSILNIVTGAVSGDMLGSYGLLPVAGGFLIPVPNADVGSNIDAGSIFLVSNVGAPIGQQSGGFAGDFFGQSIDQFTIPGAILVNDFNSDAGGPDSGRLVSLEPTKLAINWTINGNPGENLGSSGSSWNLANGDIIFFSSLDDTGGVDAGRLIQADPLTGTVRGSLFGQSDSERLGELGFVYERGNGNYFYNSRFASPGGVANAGTVYLVNGTTGGLIGQVDGTAVNEGFSNSINTFSLPGNDILITNTVHTIGSFTNAGTVVQAAAVNLGGGNIVRGRIDGASTNEFFGSYGFTDLGNNNFVFTSPNGDPGGRVDAGSVFVYDVSTGSIVNQINGATAGDRIGSNGVLTTSTVNFYLPNPNTDIGGVTDAGEIQLVNGTNGTIIGRLRGNAMNERLGQSYSYLDSNDLMVLAPLHNVGALAGAGSIFRITNQNLGGGNITKGTVAGANAGDGLGSSFPSFYSNIAAAFNTSADANGIVDSGSIVFFDPATFTVASRVNGISADEFFGSYGLSFVTSDVGYVRSPSADVGGVVDAGQIVFIDMNTGQVLNRVSGTSADEQFGINGLSFATSDIGFVRSPNADAGGLVDSGQVAFININTGQVVNRVNGISEDENFGSLFPSFLPTGDLLFRSPDADLNGMFDVGSIVFVDPNTGQVLGRENGISANERFGAYFPTTLANGILLFPSPDATVDGATAAGRFAFVDPSAIVNNPQSDFTFDNTPGTDFFITNGTLVGLLNGGAKITLQANNDITTMVGATLVATGGQLTLQAGRSININSLLSVPVLNLIANETEANGVQPAFRDSGDGNVAVYGATASADFLNISAQDVSVEGGSSSTGDPVPGVLKATNKLVINANGNVAFYGATATADVLNISAENLSVETGSSSTGDPISAALTVGNELNINVEGNVAIRGATAAANVLNVSAQSVFVEAGSSSGGVPLPGVLMAGTGLNITAADVQVKAGDGLDAFASIISLGTLDLTTGTLDIYGGSGTGLGALPLDSELLGEFQGVPNGYPPFGAVFAVDALNVTADSITLNGGSGDQAFAALVSTGEFNITADSTVMTPGSGDNADAVFLALGGIAEIAVGNCSGCDQLFIDPLLELEAGSGVYIAGLLQDPSTTAILSMLDERAENDVEAQEEDEDEDEGPGECR